MNKLIQAIQSLEHNISYTQGEIETQNNIRENNKNELNELKVYQSQIDLKIDEIIKKISDYLLSKLQDKSLKNKIDGDLSKVKEGDFKTKNIDNWINQIWIQYIGLVDEAYSKVIFLSKIIICFKNILVLIKLINWFLSKCDEHIIYIRLFCIF